MGTPKQVFVQQVLKSANNIFSPQDAFEAILISKSKLVNHDQIVKLSEVLCHQVGTGRKADSHPHRVVQQTLYTQRN